LRVNIKVTINDAPWRKEQMINTASVQYRFKSFSQLFTEYLNIPLSEYYSNPINRHFLYLIITLLTGLCTFLALETYFFFQPIRKLPLSFGGMYAWMTTLNFGLCYYLMDEWFTRLGKNRGIFIDRTVGKLWVIFLVTYVLAFIIQRTLIYQTTQYYFPDFLYYCTVYPHRRPTNLESFFFCLPFWMAIAFFSIHIALKFQSKLKLKNYGSEKLPKQKKNSSLLPVFTGNGTKQIDIENIVYITVEDHYSRIYLKNNHGNVLVKMTLKKLITMLPKDHFVQIHRSHVISLSSISKIRKAGRSYQLVLNHSRGTLPISRHRFPAIYPMLQRKPGTSNLGIFA